MASFFCLKIGITEKHEKTEMAKWQKGQSGNPKGRPRKVIPVSHLLRAVGNEKTQDGLTKKRALARKAYERALAGDVAAMRLIYEYCDGKPLQRNDVTLDGGINLFVVEQIISAEPEDDDSPAPDAGGVSPE